MDPYRWLPISHAISAARVLLELANDAVDDALLPKPMAAAMSATANDAALRLDRFVDSHDAAPHPDFGEVIRWAQADFEEIAQLADLVIDHDLTPRNVCHVATAIRYTVERVLQRLEHVEQSLDADAPSTPVRLRSVPSL